MESIQARIQRAKKERHAVILAHTYQPGEVQDIADYVGDSYGLSVEASRTDAECIIFCGVRFMAETAAILNPARRVILPTPDAGCPMADMITVGELLEMKRQHPGYLVMCYVNSTAEVKAHSDICCTSSNALTIVRRLGGDQGIIFVPDRHLGSWVGEQTGRTMVLWDGFCPTHQLFTPEILRRARQAHPAARLLIHPEAAPECRALADAVLSTGGMCDYVQRETYREFILATEAGILHTLRRRNPEKTYYGFDDLAICPNMKLGSLQATLAALEGSGGETIEVAPQIAHAARGALQRMLDLSAP